jgi:hypothetical protein
MIFVKRKKLNRISIKQPRLVSALRVGVSYWKGFNNMKRDYLINLNTAVDLIYELRQSGKIDREIESLFVQVLYKTKDYKKQSKKTQFSKEEQSIYSIPKALQEIFDTLGMTILRYETILKKIIQIEPLIPEHQQMITNLYQFLVKCSLNSLEFREDILGRKIEILN